MRIPNKYLLAAVLIIMAATPSCRKDSDYVPNYGEDDCIVMSVATESFANQFKAVWTALNSSYSIWDYELEYGLDWDEIYWKYLPVFESLDRDYDKETNPLPDETLRNIYSEIFNRLHDGHLRTFIKNLHTGNDLDFQPPYQRIYDLVGEKYLYRLMMASPSLDYYAALPENDIRHLELFNGGVFRELPPTYECYAEFFHSSLIFDVKDIRQYYPMYEEYFGEDAEHLLDFYENHLVKCLLEACAIFDSDKSPEDQIQEYYQYYFENIQPLEQAPENFVMEYEAPLDGSAYEVTGYEKFFQEGCGMSLFSALINESVPYFNCSGFEIYALFLPDVEKYYTTRSVTFAIRWLTKCWRKWFDDIQRLSAEGKLKGVILDLRNNKGGSTSSAPYVAGALTNEIIQFGYSRLKDGPGRFDYSPLYPDFAPILPEEHVSVTCPIIILQNYLSVSMSESTALTLSQLPNTRLVGTRTFGAFAMNMVSSLYYSEFYSGYLGSLDYSGFSIQEPYCAFFDNNLNCLEGRGVDPTEGDYIELDIDTFETTGRDNQFEHALDIIFGN